MNSHTSELKSPSHELTCTQLTGVSCPTQTTSDGTDLAAWWLSLLGSAAVESNTLMDSTRFTAACIDDGHDIDEPLQVHRKARSRKQRAAGIYLPMSASRLPASHLPKTLHAAIIFHGLLMSKTRLSRFWSKARSVLTDAAHCLSLGGRFCSKLLQSACRGKKKNAGLRKQLWSSNLHTPRPQNRAVLVLRTLTVFGNTRMPGQSVTFEKCVHPSQFRASLAL